MLVDKPPFVRHGGTDPARGGSVAAAAGVACAGWAMDAWGPGFPARSCPSGPGTLPYELANGLQPRRSSCPPPAPPGLAGFVTAIGNAFTSLASAFRPPAPPAH